MHYSNLFQCNAFPDNLPISFPQTDFREKIEEAIISSENEVDSKFSELQRAYPEFEFPSQLISGTFDELKYFENLPAEDQAKDLAILSAFLFYITVRPGVLAGAIDAFLLAPIQSLTNIIRGRRSYKRTDFVIGRRLGEGSFGTVFEGAIVPSGIPDEELGRRSKTLNDFEGEKLERVVLKKVKIGVYGAEQCGEVEEWFNLRLQRVAPESCAKYLGSFVADKSRGQFVKGGKWLVWSFEGEYTLNDFLSQRDFPLNLSDAVFGESYLRNSDPTRKKSIVIRRILRKILTALQKVHSTGIVHRDVKPSNIIITDRPDVKLIDFGAATDLRVGKNYVPDLAMLDPDYCPPELYVLPDSTPKPPAEPLAALLSPLLWIVNHPDLFDIFSCGIVFLQMAVPQLRTAIGFKSFRQELMEADFDLKEWRRTTRLKPDLDTLLVDGGRGFDLAAKMVAKRGTLSKGRLSAAEALRHPYFLLAMLS